jgi:hypothetical protein
MNKDSKISPCNIPDSLPLSKEEREKIMETAFKRLVMINGKVYGLEDDAEQDVEVDCASLTATCKAFCCTYVFALTQEEAKNGFYKYNTEKPFYIARDADGYCPYIDRTTFKCGIHDKRPLRCRKYACPQAKKL